ncbi:MAG: lipopolysaccharide biosynthesis protein [Sphingomonadaceae bacterium]|nr:lipopolysaccharide biosynthesis protein [Sphingomonadaceae bacterium]
MAHRVRHAVLWRSGSQIAGQLAMWASTFLVIRLLSPADYGLFAMTQVVLALAGLMNGYSFAGALVQAEEVDDERIGRVFGMLICLNFGLAAAQFAIAPAAAIYYRAPLVADMLRVQSLLHLTTPFIIMPQALLARRIDFRTQGRVNLVAAALGAVTAPACAWAGFGAWTLVAAPLVMFVARAIGLQLVGRWWVRPRFGVGGAAALFGMGGAMLASDIFWFIQTQADTFIGGRLLDPHNLGLYTEGLFLTQILLNKFIPAINEVAFPAYARMQADRAAVARGFLRAVRLIMLAALPFYLGLAVTAGPLVRTVMGDHWAGAIPVVRLLALAMPFAILQILYAPATNALGRAGVAARVSAAGAIVMPVAFLVAVRAGPQGMAAAWIAGAPLMAAIASGLSLPVIGIRPSALLAAIAPALKPALVMMLGVMAIDGMLPAAVAPALRLAVLVPSGGAVYAAALLLLSRDAVAELRALIGGRSAA